jgi:hypothetical protein
MPRTTRCPHSKMPLNAEAESRQGSLLGSALSQGFGSSYFYSLIKD